MHMNNQPVEISELTYKTKQCAQLYTVQYTCRIKQLCSYFNLQLVELYNQAVCLIMVEVMRE